MDMGVCDSDCESKCIDINVICCGLGTVSLLYTFSLEYTAGKQQAVSPAVDIPRCPHPQLLQQITNGPVSWITRDSNPAIHTPWPLLSTSRPPSSRVPLLARYAFPPSSESLANASYSSLMLLLVSFPASDFAAACFLLRSCGSLPRPLLRTMCRCQDPDRRR